MTLNFNDNILKRIVLLFIYGLAPFYPYIFKD